ncbi:MAG: ABC transporter permease [Planctomycetota bacterium]
MDYLNIFRTPSQQVPIFAWVMQMEFSRRLAKIAPLLLMSLPIAIVSLVVCAAALREATRLPTATVGSGWRQPRPFRLGPVGKVLGVLFCGGVLATALLAPAGQLVVESGGMETIRRVLQEGGAGSALGLSTGLALGAVLITVPVALILAEAGRHLDRTGQVVLGLLVMAPLLVSPSVLPIGALGMWDMGWLTTERGGAPWNPIYDTPLLAAFVVIARVLPFTLAATWASLREIEPSLHEAGTLTGVPWDIRMRRLVVPLVRPGIGLGALLAFVFALRELDGLAVVQTEVLVRRMWAALHFARDESVAAMAVILLLVMAVSVGVAWFAGLLKPRDYSATALRSNSDS